MEQQIFQKFREIIHRESGIALSNEKVSLLQNRISKRLRALGLTSDAQYLEVIESGLQGDELFELIDAVSTNVTYFWREPSHFLFLTEQCKKMLAQGKQEVKIWCAASSSGEEPYTLAMCVAEARGRNPFTARVLATDICARVLKHAMAATYDQSQLRDMPKELIEKYMRVERPTQQVTIRDDIRESVTVRKLNLSQFPYPLKGPLDFIFCRNVMIYFDLPLRQKVIAEFERILAPGGYLLLGHSENLLGVTHSLSGVQTGVYQKK